MLQAKIVLGIFIILLAIFTFWFCHKCNQFTMKRLKEYFIAEYEAERRENEAFRKAQQKSKESQRPITQDDIQDDYAKWKAAREKAKDQGGFVDLDAPIILPWQRTA